MAWQPDLANDPQAREHCRLELHGAGTNDVDLATWALKWRERLDKLLAEHETSASHNLRADLRATEREKDKAEAALAKTDEAVGRAIKAIEHTLNELSRDTRDA